MKNHPSPSVFEPIGKQGLRGPLKAFSSLHVGRRWEDYTFEERRELLDLLRDNLQSLLPLLWEVYDKKPLADWGARMAGALALLNEWEDFGFETVPFALKEIDLSIEDLELFTERAAGLSASARRDWVRRLVGGIEHRAGVAAGEWASLLELELLSLQAKRAELSAEAEVARAKREAAEVRADAAAAQAARRKEKRALDLLEELKTKADTLLQRSDALPVLVRNAELAARNAENAMARPLQMAREIRELASRELSRDAVDLFFELEANGGSVRAASRKLGIPYETARRWNIEKLDPFREQHRLPAPGNKGKHRIFPLPPNK